MAEFLIVIVIVLFLIIMGLLWVITQQSRGLQVSIPQEALELLNKHQEIAIMALKELAKLTPNKTDDAVLDGLFPEPPAETAPVG